MGLWENYSTNALSPQYSDEQRGRNRAKSNARDKMKTAELALEKAGQEVEGLCPKKDSCEKCRNARMADKEYMAMVEERQKLWGEYERLATRDNAIAHDCMH
jgi:hypothetical protein